MDSQAPSFEPSDPRDELIAQMLVQGPGTVLGGLMVAVAAAGILTDGRTDMAPWWWCAAYALIAGARIAVTSIWLRRPGRLRVRGLVYAAGAFLAGCCWPVLLLFYEPLMPIYQQLFLLVMMVGIPVAAIPGDALYPPVYAAFATPVLGGLIYWTVAMAPGSNEYFLLIALAYTMIVGITAAGYGRGLLRATRVSWENRRLVAELEQMAYLDPLTGLGNRRWLDERLDAALANRRRRGTRLALLVIDIDRFKAVNDRLGHQAGDRILSEIAARLRECLREGDALARGATGHAARLGGDEFIVVLEDSDDAADAERAAERIRELAAAVASGDGPAATVSVGIALAPDHGDDGDTLMRAADQALYRAKDAGRNCHRLYDPNYRAGDAPPDPGTPGS